MILVIAIIDCNQIIADQNNLLSFRIPVPHLLKKLNFQFNQYKLCKLFHFC